MSRFPSRTAPPAAKPAPAPSRPAPKKTAPKAPPVETTHVARISFPGGNPRVCAGTKSEKRFGTIPGVLVLLNRADPKDSVAFATDGSVCTVVHCEVVLVDEAASLPGYWLVPNDALGDKAHTVLVYANGDFMSTDGAVSPKGERFTPPMWSIASGLESRVVAGIRSFGTGVRSAVFAGLDTSNLLRCAKAVTLHDYADVGMGDSYGPAFVSGPGGVAMLSTSTTNSRQYAEPATRTERIQENRDQAYAVIRKFINLLSGVYSTPPMADPPTGSQLLLPGGADAPKPAKPKKAAPASPPPPPPPPVPANEDGYDID